MGDAQVRRTRSSRRAGRANGEADDAPATPPTGPTPAETVDQASAALHAARERSARRRRPRPRQRLALSSPRMQLPASSPVQLAPELALRGPQERPTVSLEVPDPRAQQTLQEAETARLMAELEPPERERLSAALAETLADDAVDRLQGLVDVVNALRARRSERRGEEREPIALDRAALREMLTEGLEAGLDAGFKLALRAVLEAVVGEPAKSREELLAEPPEVELLSPDERQLFVQLPPIPFG